MPVLTKDQVLEAAFELLPEEREEIAEWIINAGFDPTEAQKNEIRRRRDELRQNPEIGVSWSALKAQLEGR